MLVGHLAISPLNTAVPAVPGAHHDAATAQAALDELLGAAADDGSLRDRPAVALPGGGAGHGADRRIVPAFVG